MNITRFFNSIALTILLMVAGCASASHIKPVSAPPPAPVAEQPTPTPPPVVLSTSVKEYKGSTWSVSLPDNMVVNNQDDDGVSVKAEDRTVMAFMRAASTDDTDTAAQKVVIAMLMRGHRASFMGDTTVDNRPAKVIIYQGGKGALAFVVFTTGKYVYACVYMGPDGKDRVVAYKAMLASVKIDEKPVKAHKTSKHKK